MTIQEYLAEYDARQARIAERAKRPWTQAQLRAYYGDRETRDSGTVGK